MKSLLFAAVAVLIAAAIAYVWVVPEPFDRLRFEMDDMVEMIEPDAESAQPAKDTSRIETPAVQSAPGAVSDAMPDVGVLDTAALPFETGCGLFLSRRDEEDLIFIDGAGDGSNGAMPAAMMIDGQIVLFERTTADGEPLGFGQYPRQVFDSADNSVRVVVDIDLGESVDQEDAPVTGGEITVMKAGRPTLNFPVSGGAGC